MITKKDIIVLAGIFSLLAGGSTRAAASTYTWNGGGKGVWQKNNWKGIPSDPNPTDVAVFDLSSSPTTASIDFSSSETTNNGSANEAVGAIELTSDSANPLTIVNDNSSDGLLTLKGATFNGLSNVIIYDAATSSNSNINFLGSGTLGIALGNTSSVIEIAEVTHGNVVSIVNNISEAQGNSSLTVLGGGNATLDSTTYGTLQLSGTNTFTGGLIVGDTTGTNAAILQLLNTTSSLPTTGNITINANSQVLFTVSGTYGSASQLLTITGTGNNGKNGDAVYTSGSFTWLGNVALGAPSTLAPTDVIDVSNDSAPLQQFTISGTLSGSGILQKKGSGNLILSGTSSSFTGSILITNGTVTINVGTSIATGDLTLGEGGGKTTGFTVSSGTDDVGNLSGTWASTDNNATLTQTISLATSTSSLVVTQSTDASFGNGSGSGLTAAITGAGSFVKNGAATLSLTGANTFTGSTTVNSGTLSANLAGALGNTSGIAVNGGTLLLNQTAAAIGRNVALNGGKLALNSSAKVTESLGSLTLSANSAIDFGSTTLGSTINFSQVNNGYSGTLTIDNWSASDTLSFTSNSNNLALFVASDVSFDINGTMEGAVVKQISSTEYDLVPIPEPRTIAAGLALLAFILWKERRRFAPLAGLLGQSWI